MVVSDSGEILQINFEVKGEKYKIIATEKGGNSVWEAIDHFIRLSDNKIFTITRLELKKRT